MITKRKFYGIVAVIAVAAAGLGVGLAVTAPSPPTVHPVSEVLRPPAHINATCAHDVTQPLGNWLLSVPNGTPGHDTVVKLKKGACYELDGSIWWRGPRNIVLDGNGATIKQETVTEPAPTVGGENNPAIAPYCGSRAFMDDDYTAITTNVLMLSVEGGCDITVENLTIIGRHIGTGTSGTYQPDSFISFYGTQRGLVKSVHMVGPYGDYVTATGLHEAGPTSEYPATDLTVEDCLLTGSGRQGISATGNVHRMTIIRNTFTGAFTTASLFDIEDDAIYPAVSDSDIQIAHNKIEGESYAFLLSAQTGAELERVAFNHNILTGGAQMRIFISPHAFGGTADNSIEIEDNTSQAASTWPGGRAPVNVYNTVDVLVANNVDPRPTYAGTGYPFARFNDGKTDLSCGNTTPGGKAFGAACPSPLPVIAFPTVATLPT
jgi:hypothetical protein